MEHRPGLALEIKEASHFLGLLLDGDTRGAHRVATELYDEHGAAFLYEQVVTPALQRIGELWAANRLTIADEHLATATAQTAIAALYPRFPWTHGGPRVLVACVPGEHHDFGARMVADLLTLDGWEALFLGTGVPPDDVARKARDVGARAVALSVTLEQHLAATSVLVEAIRRDAPAAKILVGGLGARHELETLGVDGRAACGSEAVEVLRVWK